MFSSVHLKPKHNPHLLILFIDTGFLLITIFLKTIRNVVHEHLICFITSHQVVEHETGRNGKKCVCGVCVCVCEGWGGGGRMQKCAIQEKLENFFTKS